MNPATNEVVTTFAVGTVADVDRAVAAARRAFDEGPWPRLTAKERKKYFNRLVALITEHGEELNRLQTLEMGMPIAFSSMSVVSSEMAAGCLRPPRRLDRQDLRFDLPDLRSRPDGGRRADHELPRAGGVVAAIIPWNAPMMLFAQKVAPALATGCTVIVKPSEYAVLTSLKLAALIEEAGFPPGVFNLVPVRATHRRGAHHPPRRRQGHLHREPRRGQADPRSQRRHHQAGHPRAGRQVAQHHFRGRARASRAPP
jgi:aldehyde dehydrogenase (NAD+)